ncbi:hypothetical protein HY570_01800 [Candidatus Micrarchaeota archaeon]|nr:hypothetical protein [Candidatus Micrarchaeota archaeon]
MNLLAERRGSQPFGTPVSDHRLRIAERAGLSRVALASQSTGRVEQIQRKLLVAARDFTLPKTDRSRSEIRFEGRKRTDENARRRDRVVGLEGDKEAELVKLFASAEKRTGVSVEQLNDGIENVLNKLDDGADSFKITKDGRVDEKSWNGLRAVLSELNEQLLESYVSNDRVEEKLVPLKGHLWILLDSLTLKIDEFVARLAGGSSVSRIVPEKELFSLVIDALFEVKSFLP